MAVVRKLNRRGRYNRYDDEKVWLLHQGERCSINGPELSDYSMPAPEINQGTLQLPTSQEARGTVRGGLLIFIFRVLTARWGNRPYCSPTECCIRRVMAFSERRVYYGLQSWFCAGSCVCLRL